MFVDQVMTDDERNYFFDISVPSLVVQALLIESRRPYNGWRYSLQQQGMKGSDYELEGFGLLEV